MSKETKAASSTASSKKQRKSHAPDVQKQVVTFMKSRVLIDKFRDGSRVLQFERGMTKEIQTKFGVSYGTAHKWYLMAVPLTATEAASK